MTGGGSVFTTDGERVTHGFEIHCDLREPNNIEVNWAPKNNFHLTELTGALCTDSLRLTRTRLMHRSTRSSERAPVS